MSRLEGLSFRPSTLVPKRKDGPQPQKGWYPPALRWWSLIITALLCWTFIAVLQYYLRKSQTHGGVIFATTVNSLPLRRSFWYLYLPTIIAVIFSILVVWIDHDAKRYEPYRQMARPCGASAENSILLSYPFDYLPVAPIIAAKRRHWLVFWASLATTLTTFGVVPLQAGIFSTRPITRGISQDFVISDDFIHSSVQEQGLTLSYAQSVYGILELNETLPAFTTRNYTLRPFTASDPKPSVGDSWTTRTILYSMSLGCEMARAAGARNHTWIEEELTLIPPNTTVLMNHTYSETSAAGFNNSAGCYVSWPQQNGAVIGDLINPTQPPRFRKFSASYMGYFTGTYATYMRGWKSIKEEPFCGVRGKGTFFATFTQNKEKKQDPLSDITAIFCRPSYYEQDVETTVDARTGRPEKVSFIGTKRNISAEIFNTTVFEETLASGIRLLQTRQDNLPLISLPRYLETLYDTDLTPSTASPMMTTVMSVSKDRFQDLLNAEKLARAYEVVYQLFFARAMTDILNTNFTKATTTKIVGSRQTQMEAVTLEPIFTYLVEGLLVIISVAAIALIYLGYVGKRSRALTDDPASLAHVMSLVADDTDLLARFGDLDCASTQYFHQKLHASGYKLGQDHRINNVALSSELQQPLLKTSQPRLSVPMRPKEFHVFTGVPFISLFVALIIVLAVLFARSRPHGLPLPSENRIVQNLVSQYLPTAIATLIEPLWIMINRLFCVLQPLEQMRGPRAATRQILTLKYGSIPPQLTLFKAARAGHFLLAVVCAMSLLANLLATAFAGLFFSTTLTLPRSAPFSPPFEAKFVHINGSSGPPILELLFQISDELDISGAYQGSTGESHFLVAESNLTRNTSLPSWTDEKAAYLPFKDSKPTTLTTGSIYQARTKYFVAEPRCKPLVFDQDYHMHLWTSLNNEWNQIFNVTVASRDGGQATCFGTSGNQFATNYGKTSRWHSQYGATLCRDGKTGAEMAITLEADRDATEEEKAICRSAVAIGWLRATHNYCQGPLDGSSFRRRQEIITDPSYHPKPYYPGFEDAASNNTFVLLCQPEIRIGDANVLVDEAGVLTEPAKDFAADPDQAPQALEKYFSNGAVELISQSNLFIFHTLQPLWHNDTFASEFIHYFINRAEGSLRLTDPTKPLPTFADVEAPMNMAYTRLFAIWLSVNRELLFVPANNTTTAQVSGTIITPEKRLLFVTPLFVISECILSIYVVVSLIVYLRRPGRYLARMPTTIAAIIALFASSAAVKDLRGTAHMTNKEREKYLGNLGCKYGYGSYVGGDDGVIHVGIEKMPFVQYLKEVSFAGSKAGRGIKSGRDSAASSSTGTRYVNVPLDDLETDGSHRDSSPSPNSIV